MPAAVLRGALTSPTAPSCCTQPRHFMCGSGWKHRPCYVLAQEHWCLERPYREKSWVTASIQPLPAALQSPCCLLELEQPPGPACLPGTVGLPRSPSAQHLGTLAPGLLTRQRALGSREGGRAGKHRSWDPHGLLFPIPLPQGKTLSFPMLKQAQLAAPHGPVPETLAGGKELICTGKAELRRFLFPPFSLSMAEVGRDVVTMSCCIYLLEKPQQHEGKHRAMQGDRAPECPQGGERQRCAKRLSAPAPGCSSPGGTGAARHTAW